MRSSSAAILLASLMLLAGCGGSPKQASAPVRQFPQVQVPSMYQTDEERRAYALEHYWDGLFREGFLCDSSHVNGVAMAGMEQAMGIYVSNLLQMPLDAACESMRATFERMEAFQRADTTSNVYAEMAALMEKYLYDPNSPLRDEDIYQPFVECLSQCSLTPKSRRAGFAHDAEQCALNCRGTKAADFVFKEIGGRTHTLYSVKAKLIVLFFSNPGCEACKEIIDALMAREYLLDMIDSGELAIVNVYIDEELDKWKEYQEVYPKTWYNGYDPTFTIRTDVTYSIRAIPSLYLLDSEKRVLMKDVPQERVLQYLDNISLSQ